MPPANAADPWAHLRLRLAGSVQRPHAQHRLLPAGGIENLKGRGHLHRHLQPEAALSNMLQSQADWQLLQQLGGMQKAVHSCFDAEGLFHAVIAAACDHGG